eukprot:805804-Rhodomonas_salina.2
MPVVFMPDHRVSLRISFQPQASAMNFALDHRHDHNHNYDTASGITEVLKWVLDAIAAASRTAPLPSRLLDPDPYP